LSDQFRLVPEGPYPHLLWGKSGCPQSFVPITEKPNPLVIKMWKVVLEISGEDLAVLFVDLLYRSNPLPFAMRTVVGAGTMIYTEGFRAEFIRAEPVFLHVGFTVSAMR
jgi:hypothetical protein